jgi:hypothetical protein
VSSFLDRVHADAAITRGEYDRWAGRAGKKDPTRGTPDDAYQNLAKALQRPVWFESAACRGMGPDMFFPDAPGANGTSRSALRVCAECTVRSECAAEARSLPYGWAIYGIWGGESARRRRPSLSSSTLRECKWCGAEFKPRFGTRMYCDDDCRLKAQHAREKARQAS